jgi:hypothetical protein
MLDEDVARGERVVDDERAVPAERRVLLRVSDDGRGGVTAQGNGLAGIRERVRSLGGTLELDSPRGKGTVLRVRIPLAASASAVVAVAGSSMAAGMAPVSAGAPMAVGAPGAAGGGWQAPAATRLETSVARTEFSARSANSGETAAPGVSAASIVVRT